MIKPYNGFKAEESEGKVQPLPAGAYIGTILGAKEEMTQFGDSIILQLDVAEGEYKDYYRNRFETDKNSQYGQKYKGTYRLYVPTEGTGDQKGEIRFNSAIGAVEKSNPGYKWDWDEKTLKLKKIGFVVGNVEYSVNGYTGWTTRIRGLCSVQKVIDGTYYKFPDKPLQRSDADDSDFVHEAGGNGGYQGYQDVTNDDELPF